MEFTNEGKNTSNTKEVNEYAVFKSAFGYCAAIIVLPILAFLVCKLLICEGILGLSLVTSSVSAALCAVIVLHISLGVFIYKAYTTAEKPSKQD